MFRFCNASLVLSLSGIWLPCQCRELGDALTPIKSSTQSDPAGFGLMIFCIGLLVFLVLTIFVGTGYYVFKGGKKRPGNAGAIGGPVHATETADSTDFPADFSEAVGDDHSDGEELPSG